MNAVTECLNNIKMLKLYDWTDLFLESINEKRNEELAVSWTRVKISILVMCLFNSGPLLLQSVSIVACIGFGYTIGLATIYTVITLFNILQGPVSMLPWFIGQLIEFIVSMKRIQRFLLCPEIMPAMITQRGDPDIAITVNQPGAFHWGVKDKEAERAKEALSKQKKAIKSREEAKKDAK